MESIIVENVTFTSEGHSLKGRIYRPDAEKTPAVAICHGYPGDTKNMDLAEELALNGITVLIFYYQGAWGSEGTYRFANFASSTVSAIKYLKSLPYVDKKRVGLVSHSMGALPLTKVMSGDRSLKTGVLMSPASDISKWLGEGVIDNIFGVFVNMAAGKLSFGPQEEYKKDMLAAVETLNPMKNITKIKAPLMVVVGSEDKVTAPEDCKALFMVANDPKKWVEISGADHGYSEHRIPLQKAVLAWLKEHL